VEEKNLTVTISALRKALGETPDEHRFIVTIPGRGYSFVAPLRKPQQPIEESTPEPPRRATAIAAVAAGVLIIVLIGFAYSGFSNRTPPPDTDQVQSLAVLPFKFLESDPDDKVLGLGMTDALITQLSNVRKIIVRPTRTVQKYVDIAQDPASIGRDL